MFIIIAYTFCQPILSEEWKINYHNRMHDAKVTVKPYKIGVPLWEVPFPDVYKSW